MAMNERVKKVVFYYLGFVVAMVVLGITVSMITGPPEVVPPAAMEAPGTP